MTKEQQEEPPILKFLEKAFEAARDKKPARYPYDRQTNTIRLPGYVDAELRRLIEEGNKVEAVKRVTQLTGAGLRVSKDYVDNLVKR